MLEISSKVTVTHETEVVGPVWGRPFSVPSYLCANTCLPLVIKGTGHKLNLSTESHFHLKKKDILYVE